MPESRTRPISFRVDAEVLDLLEAAGKSPAAISRAALEREARIARQAMALARLRKRPARVRLHEGAAQAIRRDRDRR